MKPPANRDKEPKPWSIKKEEAHILIPELFLSNHEMICYSWWKLCLFTGYLRYYRKEIEFYKIVLCIWVVDFCFFKFWATLLTVIVLELCSVQLLCM